MLEAATLEISTGTNHVEYANLQQEGGIREDGLVGAFGVPLCCVCRVVAKMCLERSLCLFWAMVGSMHCRDTGGLFGGRSQVTQQCSSLASLFDHLVRARSLFCFGH